MQIKILTYNVLDGGAGREALILEVLQHARPDVVILEEVYEQAFVEYLGQALDMPSFFGESNRQRHVALLSHFPVESFQSHHPNPPIWRNFIEAELNYLPGKRLRLFGVHLMAGLELPLEIWRWWEAQTILSQVRRSQNERAAQEKRDPKDEPCLIGGDFNAIASYDVVDRRRMPLWMQVMIVLQGNRVYRTSLNAFQKAGFIDSFRRLVPLAHGFTYPAARPYTRLDYLLVNAALAPAIRRCQVVTVPEAARTASDHYPLLLELELE